MIQKYLLILMLMLVPCIVSSSNQIDSIISDLKKKNEILQDSVAHLLKQSSEMQQQLKDLMSKYHPSQKKIADLEMMIFKSIHRYNQLLAWKNEVDSKVDSKVNRFKSVVNMTVLNQRLQPMNFEIEKLKNSLETLSQKEKAVELNVKRQVVQMEHLFKQVKGVKDKLPSIEKSVKLINRKIDVTFGKFQQTVEALKKKDDDYEIFHNETDRNIKMMQASIDSFRAMLRKLNTPKKPF